MPIKVLSPDLAAQIAAGEVVERPASVVKELVENALDAGATQITVELGAGGLRLIRVVDNGAGIPVDEVELAFQRHATSKIASFDDLYALSTLGFRGEALPSIAAVAQVTLVSRPTAQAAGAYVSLKDGQIAERGPRAGPPGTTITVRQLFANVPARLKFLRSASTETGHVDQILSQYALAYPEVRFTLLVDGRLAFQSPGSGRPRDVLAAVYGLEVARAMLEVDAPDASPRVSGFVSPPAVNRVNRQHLSFFVNRRWIQSRTLARAVEDAYGGMLMVGRHPIVALELRMPPDELDVNIHPSKREVKFQRDREVYLAMQRAVKGTLLASAPVTGFGSRPSPAGETAGPAAQFAGITWGNLGGAIVETAGREDFAASATSASGTPAPTDAPASARLPILRVVGQVGSTYIVGEGPDGMYLIDQHTAHERVLYERLRTQQQERTVDVQGLLEPLTLELTPRQALDLADKLEALADLGFVVEPFGEQTYLVRAVPAVLRGSNLRAGFGEILEVLQGEGPSETAPDWRDKICITLACHGAVRAGQTLTLEEMRELVQQLEQTETPHTCPHGRPIIILLSAAQLEKEFGRR